MKTLFSLLVLGCLLTSNTLNAQVATFFEKANDFFSTYVEHNRVKYQQLYHKSTELTALVEQIKTTSLTGLSVQEQKSFYINAYNVLVVKTVMDHYPIASPNEVVEFWDGINHQVAGREFTLQALEKYILQTYKDPRLHFALTNGSMACVPIANAAYQPDKLEEQLNQRVIGAVNNPQWVDYQPTLKHLKLPLLFERHQASFTPSVLDFLNTYRVKPVPKNVQITYNNEDWTLNSYESTPSIVRNKKKVATGSYTGLAQVITLPKGSAEFICFNSIYTVGIGSKESGTRNTYFNSYFTASYGVTGRLDIGLSFLFRSSRERDHFGTSPFTVLNMERSPAPLAGRNPKQRHTYSDFGLSHMGFQVRFAPFKNINLSFEQGFLLPIQNLPKNNTVDNSIYSITQAYYIHPISSKMQLFLALTYWQGIRPGEKFKFQVPLLRGFLNYFVTPRFSVFATSMYFLEWGVGAKYLLTPKLEIQFMYSYYLPFKGAYDLLSPGANSIMTYNVGLRYRL